MVHRSLFIVLLGVLLPSGQVSVQTPVPQHPGACPGDFPELRSFVEDIVRTEAKRVDREELDLAHVTDEPLRVLGTEPADYPVCARLYREVPAAYRVRGPRAPDTVVFYQLGDRYIMALTTLPIRPGEPMGADQFTSFDLELNRIGTMIY